MLLRLLLLAALVALFPFPLQAANPAFNLTFVFRPPVSNGSAAPPEMLLDVCNDASCAALVGSIPLTCSMQNVLTNNTLAVTRCSAHASLNPRNTNPNLALLGRPEYLRLRSANLLSPPFSFPGGQPALPAIDYAYWVTPGPGGFAVTAR